MIRFLDFARSDAGKGLGVFAVLGFAPVVTWHDAAIAAASASVSWAWMRAAEAAEPGETALDVLACALSKRAEQLGRLAVTAAKAIAKLPAVEKRIAQYPKVKGMIDRLLSVKAEVKADIGDDAIEPTSDTSPAQAFPPAPLPPDVVRNSTKPKPVTSSSAIAR